MQEFEAQCVKTIMGNKTGMGQTLTEACCYVVIGFSVLALSGWGFGLPVLASFSLKYIPMAPGTALSFLLVSISLLSYVHLTSWRFGRIPGLASPFAVIIFSLYKITMFFWDYAVDIEHFLVRGAGTFGAVPSGHMSPLTAVNFLLAGTVLILLYRATAPVHWTRQAASLLASLIIICNTVLILGYLYGAPLLYGGTFIPVALTTAVSFVFLGAGLIIENGPDHLPLRPFVGRSTRAMLMRAFLPVSVAAIVISDLIETRAALFTKVDPAVLSALLALAAAMIAGAVVSHIAGRIGTTIDITQEALEKESGRLEAASMAAQVALWEWDIKSGNLEWSGAVDAMLGYERGGLLRSVKAWEEVIHPEDRGKVVTMLTAHIEKNAPYDIEYRVTKRDGSSVWWHDAGSAQRYEDGTAYKMSGACVDITERKQAEAELRESEERFQSAFEYAAVGMGLVAPDGRWLKVNRALCEVVGYTEEELLARTFQDITHPEDLETDLQYVRQMLAGEIRTYQLEKRYFHRQGHVIWINLSVSLVRDRGGNPLYFIAQVEDISQRKRADAELLKVNRTLKTLSGCNDAVMRAKDEAKLLDDICRLIVESGGYASVWVGYAEQDENKTVRPVSQCGFLPEYVAALKITWADTERGRGPTGKAIRTGKPSIAKNILSDPDYLPWRDIALKHGYSSAIALPLLDNGRVFGALNIYSSEPDPFHEEEVRLLTDLAGNLSHGVLALRAEKELAGVYETLREEVEVSTSLLKIVETLNATLDEKAMIKNIAGIASRYLKFDRVTVLLYDEDIKSFVFAGGSGLTPVEEGIWLSQSYREGDFPAVDKLRNGEMAIVENALKDDLLPRKLVDAFQTGSMVIIPIAFRGNVVGGILGDYRRGKSVEGRDISLLKGLADGLGVALQNSRLYRESIERLMELSAKVETIKAMAQLDRDILSNIDRNAILRTATALINRIIPCDRVGIILNEKDGFRIVSEWGIGEFLGRTYPISGSHCEVFEKSRISVYYNDCAQDDCPYHKEQSGMGIKSFILVPLVAKQGVIGFLDIGSARQGRLTPGHLSTAENIASQLAVALENARLYDELQQLLVGTITSLASAIDAKSTWTNGHSERVTGYAIAIGKEMGLKDEERERLRLAGLLHDIGKIGTYDIVLDKPGKLTDEEFELVKRHPKKGAEILAPIKQLNDVLPGILHHHERYDGRGYPDGLKGEDIPLHARILCVADSFDSMTADRPYRPSPGREYAVSEFMRCLGTQFDPLVVEAFLRVIDRKEM